MAADDACFSETCKVDPEYSVLLVAPCNTIVWTDGKPVIDKLKRVSRPGLRRYVGRDEMPEGLSGLGICVVSTSHGVMTGTSAKAQGYGGEVICTVS